MSANVDVVQWIDYYPPDSFTTVVSNNQVIASWRSDIYSGFILQESGNVKGPYSNSVYTTTFTNMHFKAVLQKDPDQKYFRLKY